MNPETITILIIGLIIIAVKVKDFIDKNLR